ncbi:DUF262 domain-containing protein [Streptomyces violaceus]|uniref:DUF262 domain-containing protein n=1 Tax=Streptomyces violaceus TaxID=1936 RepID=UPI002E1D2A80
MGLANDKIISQIENLLQGSVVIPSIQRDFVWMRPDVRDLFDSLYRGYPVGALLLWKTMRSPPSPNRNGWSFWTVTATGQLLQSIR